MILRFTLGVIYKERPTLGGGGTEGFSGRAKWKVDLRSWKKLI